MNLIHIRPTKKLEKKPTIRGVIDTAPDTFGTEAPLKIPAPITIGIESKNENLAASLLSNPKRIPPEIVEPDLDMPGKSASD